MQNNGPVQIDANDRVLDMRYCVKFQQAGVQQFGVKSWVYLKPTSHQITRNKQFSPASTLVP